MRLRISRVSGREMRIMFTRFSLGGAVLASMVFGARSAQAVVSVSLPGTTSFDSWENLNTATQGTGYGSSAAGTAWPAAIESNVAGSGDAQLNKFSGRGYLSTG